MDHSKSRTSKRTFIGQASQCDARSTFGGATENFVSTNTDQFSGPDFVKSKIYDILRPHFVEKCFRDGECVIKQGDEDAAVFWIESGELEVSSVDDQGKRYRIDSSGPGDVLGEMSLLTGEPRSADAIAKGPVTVLEVQSDVIRQLVKEHPEMANWLSELVARRLGSIEYDALAGKLLGGYRLVRRLGKGGMGVVYEAFDPAKKDKGSVALKMMSHRLVHNEQARKRFELEFELVRSLNSDFIVKTFDRFEAFYTYFLVLEHCEGKTLGEIVKQGPAKETIARQVYTSMAEALSYAHGCGVVHRDIKPANIMMSEDGTTKLMDFGLALPIEDLEDEIGVAGTLGYLAPEVLEGKPPSIASDYFALGITLLELLIGKGAFDDHSESKFFERIRNWSVPDIKTLRPDVSVEFCKKIESLLSILPSDRKLIP